MNTRSSQPSSFLEQPTSARSMSGINSIEQLQSLRPAIATRSSQSTSANEQPNSARSMATAAARPQLGTKPVHMVPASVPISLRPSPSADAPAESRRDPPVPILLRPPSSAMLSSDGSCDSRREKRYQVVKFSTMIHIINLIIIMNFLYAELNSCLFLLHVNCINLFVI